MSRPLPLSLPVVPSQPLAAHQASAHWPTVSPVSTSLLKGFCSSFFVLASSGHSESVSLPSGSGNTCKHLSHHLWLCTVTSLHIGFFFDTENSFSSGAPSLLSFLYLQHSARSLAHRRLFLSVYCLGGWMEEAWHNCNSGSYGIIVMFMYRLVRHQCVRLPTPWGRWSHQGNWAHKARKWWNWVSEPSLLLHKLFLTRRLGWFRGMWPGPAPTPHRHISQAGILALNFKVMWFFLETLRESY